MPEKIQIQTFSELSPELEIVRKNFGDRNFDIEEAGDPDWAEEIKEWFWKDPDTYVLAYLGDELVGVATFFKKEVEFQGEKLKIAGLGGLTVAKEHRGEGVGRKLIEERLKIAQEWGADIAFLNTDIDKLGGMFAKFGFQPLGRNYSFVGKSGQVHEDDSGMIAPINSRDKFAKVLQSVEVFFIGESNV
ncbi:MAG: GNAT family N-acetyltransferase [Candidatus Doudnabacteria bacterium]|nr:GNAT family N-acetyltransferase [Candidatus Doudnabacteria bacterium]